MPKRLEICPNMDQIFVMSSLLERNVHLEGCLKLDPISNLTMSISESSQVNARSCDSEKLKEVLMDFATTQGKSFIKFAENKTMKDCKYKPSQIEDNHALAAALHDVSPKLCNITKSAITDALRQVAAKQKEEWKLTAAVEEDWVETMNRRIRNLCHVIHQGESRRVKPKWVLQLP